MEKKETVIYDILDNKIHKFDSRQGVADFLGILQGSTTDRLRDSSLIDGRYVIYDMEKLFDKDGVKRCIPLSPRYIQNKIEEVRKEYTENIIAALKVAMPEKFRHRPVYIFNDDLIVLKVLYNHKEVGEHFNIKVGTVKTRLHRIKTKDDIRKYNMCNFRVFKELFV